MKTKQEMIYEFMLALAANPQVVKPSDKDDEISPNVYDAVASDLYEFAANMAQVYLNDGEML